MARGTRTICFGQRNKVLGSTFQPPEEGRSVQRPKCCDIHVDKDEDNCTKIVNNVQITDVELNSKRYIAINEILWVPKLNY